MAIETPLAANRHEMFSQASALTQIESGSIRTRKLASSVKPENRLEFARAMVYSVVRAYWQGLQSRSRWPLPLRKPPSDYQTVPLPSEASVLAQTIGTACILLDPSEASYRTGMIYTGMMPDRIRAELGAYYTPPALCERLLDMATEAGVDWCSARILDPACGGGAFLSPVACRIVEALDDCRTEAVLDNIQKRLYGFELDPFAAWLSQVFLDVTLGKLYHKTGTRIRSIVHVVDTMEQTPREEGFDLVVGNPPYGRVSLSPNLRNRFRRSLFGHANLYGVFTDLALRLTRPGGVIAFVTPTSFLAGEYFKNLRGLLGREAPPVSIDFVGERKGVFTDVLQETLLATYRRGAKSDAGKVHFITPGPDGSISTKPAGSFGLPEEPAHPWVMPRTEDQCMLVRQAERLPHRLADFGYTVSTGPLVWNRHKQSLRDEPGKGRYPLVWAESVRSHGKFEFRAFKRNHKPFFEPKPNETWVVSDMPCILLQRTTSKEQNRRLKAAELPISFVKKHGGVVVENHLNVIKPLDGKPKVTSAALSALLNSETVDRLFRCINGSVAVSAYELNSLPLPSPEDMKAIERLVYRRAKRKTVEQVVERLYSIGVI